MKRLFALLLCLALALPILAGCAKGNGTDEEDKGAVINAYITGELYSFDPSYPYIDDDMAKVFGLIYEGLTKINANGKVEKALAKSWNIIEDAVKNEYKMQITLKRTKWNDGRAVTAEDFIYAWKRLLSCDFSSSACALLYDIKNARAVKSGDASIDDLGLVAPETYMLEITFETAINYDNFLRNCASIALVPLREDAVTRNEQNWAKKYTTLVTNGPFSIKGLDYQNSAMKLERNPYYYRDTENDSLTKYVTPYRFVINFVKDKDAAVKNIEMLPVDLEAELQAFLDGKLFYLGDLPLDKRADYADKAVVTDLLSEQAYFFNIDNPLFADSRVRNALSLALDREYIAELLTFAKPATGLITDKVFEGLSTKKEFRDVGGDLIAATADVSRAKQLLSEAGVSGGSFTITYKLGEADKAVAEYVQSVWKGLGFDVSLRPLLATSYTVADEEYKYYTDDFSEAYINRDFDVIAIDFNMLSSDAFAVLASFSKEYSGMGIDMESGSYELVPHITGFDSTEYTALIDQAFAEKDLNKRAAILHQAEEYLIEQMPVIPLVFNQDFYLKSGELSKIDTSYFGWRILTKVKLKDYVKYLETVTTTKTGNSGTEAQAT